MKNKYCFIVLFFTASTFAQKPMDSILSNDIKMLTKFFPGSENGLSNSTYQMEPHDFIVRLDSFKSFAYANVNADQLRRRDVDAFARMMLSMYRQNYGLDSVKSAQYYELASKDERPDSLTQKRLEQLSSEMFPKKLSEGDSKELDSLIFGGLDLTDSALFSASNAYRQVVSMKLRAIQDRKYADSTKDESISRQRMLDEVLKEGYVYEYMSHENIDFVLNMSKDTVLIGEVYKNYMSKAKNQSLRESIATAYKNYKALERNAPAPNFVYRDINEKIISLKQLKGKYVYIDIWATWCGPCKMEIPHLTKLEKEYAGKNIHFVSLSVDKQKDKAAWEKYVRGNHLIGIQLMADKDFQSDFIKKFNITYIPRFILIDPAGKIVDANALRPSDQALRTQLDALL
jgi:thiol-disulfide isomerase/thioredoxin